MLNVQNGTLFGATDVDVNGILYDVSFEDGICADLYNGCDQNSDLPFSNPTNDGTLGLAANLALLNQVFIDSPLGAFDSDPTLTNGCQLNTPLFVSQGGSGLGIQWIFNDTIESKDIGTGSGGGLASFDSSIGFPDSNAYVVWSKSSVVPIPAAAWLWSTRFSGDCEKESSLISVVVLLRRRLRPPFLLS